MRDVFDAIQYKSYLPGAAPLRRPSLPTFAPPTGPSAPQYGNLGLLGAPLGPQNGSRKRLYNDRWDGDAQFQSGSGDLNGRTSKQPRWGNIGRGRFDDSSNVRGGHSGRSPPMGMNVYGEIMPGAFPNMASLPSPPPGMPPFDPNNPMAAILAMQAMGFPVSGMPSFPQAGSLVQGGTPGKSIPPVVKKQRCRDYDTKGFCARGNTCMYEHGMDSIYVPPVSKVDGKLCGFFSFSFSLVFMYRRVV